MGLRVNGTRLREKIEELAKIGATPDGGVTRLALTREEWEAKKWVINELKSIGLHVTIDKITNIFGRRNGTLIGSRPVLFGSHVDTVMNGGRFDGAYGLVAALEVMRVLKESMVETVRPLELVCFSGEEGARYPTLFGSSVVAGLRTLADAYSTEDHEGVSARQALLQLGLQPDTLEQPLKNQGYAEAFVELHIEQGPILEREHVQIGVVENIAGYDHIFVKIFGRSDHAGTTPMNDRKDPMLAAALLTMEVNRLAKESGPDGRGTVGRVRTRPGVVNIVPEMVEASIDVREVDGERLRRLREKVMGGLEASCKELGLSYEIDESTSIPVTGLSKRIQRVIASSVEDLGLTYRMMNSGAGHDAECMAKVTDTGMIFVPSKDGRSHSPMEFTDWKDLENGANILLNTVLKLSAEQAT
jgi:hydantoinase/carbamoylase family amidase